MCAPLPRTGTRLFCLAAVALALTAPHVRADVHGGIEIGAKGVKAAALDVTGGADGYDVKVLFSDTRNTTLVAGLASSGRFDPAALKDTAAAVAAFAGQMQKEHKAPAERIYVVGSSGLFSALAGKPDDVKANQEILAAAVREACGLKMTFVSPEREVELSIAGAVPAKYAAGALLLDVGSGNSKGGYRDGDKGCVSASVPYGSVTFTDAIKKRADKGSFAEAAVLLRREVLVPAIRKAVEGKPGLLKRERVYLSGGAVWAMATLLRPGDRGAYVALTAEDVEAYRKLLLKTPGAFPEPDLTSITDAGIRREAQKEIERVKETFKPEQLLAGAEILKALSDEVGFGKENKAYFARNGYLAWILAYVAERSAAPK
jgi:exopolyphosphatase/pppGpp-phosphohydrolase